MKAGIAALLLCAFAAGAFAQQAPIDPMRVIPAIENQRNVALTNQAIAEARAAMLADEVARLKAELEELKKTAPKKE
jgi:hypothetical protein